MSPLTLLQKAVIVRLAERGLAELAQQARDAWTKGKEAPDVYHKVERVPDDMVADFTKANEQALDS